MYQPEQPPAAGAHMSCSAVKSARWQLIKLSVALGREARASSALRRRLQAAADRET